MHRALLALALLATPCAADVVFPGYTTGLGNSAVYVLFSDGSDTAVQMTEGASLKAGTYTASDSAIATASLGAGTYSATIRLGDYSSPSASDTVVGVVDRFVWTGSAERDDLAEVYTDTNTTIPATLTTVNGKLGNPSVTLADDINDVLTATGTTVTQTTAGAIRTALGLASANMDTQFGDIPTAAETRAEMDSNSTQLAKLGTPAGVSMSADIAAIETAVGSNPSLLQSTTIATLTSQTVGTLTAGSADDDAYNNCVAVITDQSTSTQKAVVTIADYVGATKTYRLFGAPEFTVATGDSIAIIANPLNRKTSDTVSSRYTWRFPRNGSATAATNRVTLPASSSNIRTLAFDLDGVLEDGVTIDTASASVSSSGATVITTAIGQDDRVALVKVTDTSTAASYTVTLTFTASDGDTYTVTGTLVLQ